MCPTKIVEVLLPKKFLIIVLIVIGIINVSGCSSQTSIATSKPGFSLARIFKENRIKRQRNRESKRLTQLEKKKNSDSEKAKKEALKAQERGRQRHFENQTPDVQKRMKESRAESDKLKRKKTFWQRLLFWKNK